MPLAEGHVDGGFGLVQERINPNMGKTVVHRLPINPMDKTTLVSIVPKMIVETKPTIFPSKFIIPAAKSDGFSLLVVESASWYLMSPIEKMPPTEVQVNSLQLAQSIVQDYCVAIYLCDMKDKMPGLFFIPGEWDEVSIFGYADKKTGKDFKKILEEARIKQRNWFLAIVQDADKDWARTNGSPASIPNDARTAARILQLDKVWAKDHIASSLEPCKACGELINVNYPVCKHCHAIVDPEKAKSLNIQFADK